jgi:hypothetical protein
METQSQLSSIFNCEPWNVLDELLDVQAILDTLFEVAPEIVRHMLRYRIQEDSPFSQASEAIENILSAHRKVEERFGIDEYKWDRIVDEHDWLKGSAIDKLRSFCAKRGIIQQSGASLLATALQEHAPDKSEDEIQLDALAVIHIQQRINWIVRQLHEQAEGLAQKVSTSAEASSPWAQLEQHLKFYELKAPASAWRMVIEPAEVKAMIVGDAPLISSDSFRDALINACANFSRELIQGLILSGVKLPPGLVSELDKRLSCEFSIKPVKDDQDLVHPMSRADLLNMVRKDYTGQSNLRIIK